jgi:hypothetical protein
MTPAPDASEEASRVMPIDAAAGDATAPGSERNRSLGITGKLSVTAWTMSAPGQLGTGDRDGQVTARGRQANRWPEGRSGWTRLAWRASRALRHLMPHRHAPRRIVIWHPAPGGSRRMEVRSDYCHCGARMTEKDTKDGA